MACDDLDIPRELIDVHEYNVRFPIPQKYAGAHEVFYINPPYGSIDDGSVRQLGDEPQWRLASSLKPGRDVPTGVSRMKDKHSIHRQAGNKPKRHR